MMLSFTLGKTLPQGYNKQLLTLALIRAWIYSFLFTIGMYCVVEFVTHLLMEDLEEVQLPEPVGELQKTVFGELVVNYAKSSKLG